MAAAQTHLTRPLTLKQELFVIEYAKDFNATRAALRAGYRGGSITRGKRWGRPLKGSGQVGTHLLWF